MIGGFESDKKDDIEISRNNAKADLWTHASPNKKWFKYKHCKLFRRYEFRPLPWREKEDGRRAWEKFY